MRPIRAVALDVDGVLTDGGFWWGPNGEEWKRFGFRDVMGVSIARKAGVRFALISGEDSPLLERYAAKMGIEDVHKGIKDKAAALRAFAARRGFDLTEIAFVGDDVNDLGAMAAAGFSACPADAHPKVRTVATRVAMLPGGHGAVREILDGLLAGACDGAPAGWEG